MKSLIPLSLLTKLQPPILGPACEKCGLFKKCESPKMKPSGEGRKRIMIIGEAPGKNEDEQGRQFVGKSGDLLRKLALRCGIDLRKDCILTNALSCHPKGDFIEDPKAVEYCRPLVLDAIKKYDPIVIIPMGKYAVKSVIGHLWKDDTKGIMRWAGFRIPNRKPNVWITPTIHPAHVLRKKDKKGEYTDRGLTERWLLRHLEAAFTLTSRPWSTVPDYSAKVVVQFNVDEAAKVIRKMINFGKPMAVDYETTSLKPDSNKAKVVCCSVSNGQTTIAYPWLGDAVTATGELFRSGVRLIASNLKFEQRWTMAQFGHGGKGFENGWDTMVMSHVLDSRPGITSIKFQSYVRLGQEDYDHHLTQFLKSKTRGGNETNQIKEIDRSDLLRYCGLDSLLEWMVAQEQSRELGVKL